MSNPGADIIYGDCNIVSENGNILMRGIPGAFECEALIGLKRSSILQPAVFMRKRVLEKVGLLNEDLHYAMDYEFWIRCSQHFRATYIGEMLANFRTYEGAKSSNPLTYWTENLSIVLRYGGEEVLDDFGTFYYFVSLFKGLEAYDTVSVDEYVREAENRFSLSIDGVFGTKGLAGEGLARRRKAESNASFALALQYLQSGRIENGIGSLRRSFVKSPRSFPRLFAGATRHFWTSLRANPRNHSRQRVQTESPV